MQDTASVVDDADKLTKTLKNWCEIRRKQHTAMPLDRRTQSVMFLPSLQEQFRSVGISCSRCQEPSISFMLCFCQYFNTVSLCPLRELSMQEESKTLQNAAKLLPLDSGNMWSSGLEV